MPMPPSSPIQRRHPRIAAPLRVYDASDAGFSPMLTRNISVGGMFLVSDRRPVVGGTVELVLVHREQSVRLVGRVTHLQAAGFGVAYVEPPAETLAFVQDIIDDLLAGGASTTERRTETRPAVNVQVVWSEQGGEHRGRMRNLTRHGALIECATAPELDREVLVYLPGYAYAVDSPRPSEARGCAARVVHRAQRGFGVRFVDPTAEFRMAVDRVLADARGKGPRS